MKITYDQATNMKIVAIVGVVVIIIITASKLYYIVKDET